MLDTKPKMISNDEAEHIFKCGQVWRKYVAGEEVFVITEHDIRPTDLFGDYFKIIKIGIDKGLVKMLTLSQVKAEHLTANFVEF
ncbi:hypothetical protein [Citrobacter phage Tr1]|nr:hypothetical protein [Citrobacter phage Tr1]